MASQYVTDLELKWQAKGQDGGSALLHAAAASKREIVDLLLKQGADIDAKHVDGGTVLTEFAGEGWDDLVKQVRRSQYAHAHMLGALPICNCHYLKDCHHGHINRTPVAPVMNLVCVCVT